MIITHDGCTTVLSPCSIYIPPGGIPSTFRRSSRIGHYLREAHDFSPLVLNLEPVHLAVLLLLLDATSKFCLRCNGLLPAPAEMDRHLFRLSHTNSVDGGMYTR